MGIDIDAAQRLSLATEIASQMSDEEWNAFVAAEKTRRNVSEAPLTVDQRVRFVATTKPTRIALSTGSVKVREFKGGKWQYQVKMDGTGETFIRIPRSSLEVVTDGSFVPAIASTRKRRYPAY